MLTNMFVDYSQESIRENSCVLFFSTRTHTKKKDFHYFLIQQKNNFYLIPQIAQMLNVFNLFFFVTQVYFKTTTKNYFKW